MKKNVFFAETFATNFLHIRATSSSEENTFLLILPPVPPEAFKIMATQAGSNSSGRSPAASTQPNKSATRCKNSSGRSFHMLKGIPGDVPSRKWPRIGWTHLNIQEGYEERCNEKRVERRGKRSSGAQLATASTHWHTRPLWQQQNVAVLRKTGMFSDQTESVWPHHSWGSKRAQREFLVHCFAVKGVKFRFVFFPVFGPCI